MTSRLVRLYAGVCSLVVFLAFWLAVAARPRPAPAPAVQVVHAEPLTHTRSS